MMSGWCRSETRAIAGFDSRDTLYTLFFETPPKKRKVFFSIIEKLGEAPYGIGLRMS
jgi:hypothetical protein